LKPARISSLRNFGCSLQNSAEVIAIALSAGIACGSVCRVTRDTVEPRSVVVVVVREDGAG
jgi:hypothetical protein